MIGAADGLAIGLASRLARASVFDLDDIDALKVERDENDQRKEPTVTEKVALAEAVAERLQGRAGRPANAGNISHINEIGRTTDIAAAKAGLGSGKTLRSDRWRRNAGDLRKPEIDAPIVRGNSSRHWAGLSLVLRVGPLGESAQ